MKRKGEKSAVVEKSVKNKKFKKINKEISENVIPKMSLVLSSKEESGTNLKKSGIKNKKKNVSTEKNKKKNVSAEKKKKKNVSAEKKKNVSTEKNKLKVTPNTKGKKKIPAGKTVEKKSLQNDEKVTEATKKEERAKQKKLRLERKEKDRGYAMSNEAIRIFEEIRCNKCDPKKRIELASDLYKILEGTLKKTVRSHDTARVIQWLIKVGSPEVRSNVINEVMGDVIDICKTKYSYHIVLIMLQNCDRSVRKRVLEMFLGKVSELLKNKYSAKVVDEYYSNFSNKKDKIFMRQELYSDMFKGARNPSHTSLTQVLAENPTISSAILKSTKTVLLKLVNKKASLSTNIVTDVLYDYLEHSGEQDKLDMLEILKTNIQVLLTKPAGKRVLTFILRECTAKVKKLVVKELKAKVLEIANSDSNMFLLSIFDSVDDTVLVKKAILPAIFENAEALAKNQNGKRVLLYLVAHRDPTYFHPKEIEELKKADESIHVKKDILQKEKELLQPTVEALMSKINENVGFWFSDAKIALVTLAVLKKSEGDILKNTLRNLSQHIAECIDANKMEIIEDAGIHMVMRKLIKFDQELSKNNNFTFSEILADVFDIEKIVKVVGLNRGCFIIVLLLENGNENVSKLFKDLFKSNKVKNELDKCNFKGAELLKKLLNTK